MSHYSNPTESAAIGAVDRELKKMRNRAKQIKLLLQKNLMTDEEFAKAAREFTGIYRSVLREVLFDPGPQGQS